MRPCSSILRFSAHVKSFSSSCLHRQVKGGKGAVQNKFSLCVCRQAGRPALTSIQGHTSIPSLPPSTKCLPQSPAVQTSCAARRSASQHGVRGTCCRRRQRRARGTAAAAGSRGGGDCMSIGSDGRHAGWLHKESGSGRVHRFGTLPRLHRRRPQKRSGSAAGARARAPPPAEEWRRLPHGAVLRCWISPPTCPTRPLPEFFFHLRVVPKRFTSMQPAFGTSQQAAQLLQALYAGWGHELREPAAALCRRRDATNAAAILRAQTEKNNDRVTL